MHLSKDGELVVIHDETLDRTTNGTGAVKDRTLAELQALCADNGMSGFADARIPTLREVLELERPTGMLVNIELQTSLVWYDGIEERTLALVEALHAGSASFILRSTATASRRVRQLAPQAQTAYLFADIICDVEKYAPPTAWAGCTRGCATSRWRISCIPTSPAGWPCACGP